MRALLALVVMLVSSAAYPAMDIPARKAGLWQMTMNFEGGQIPQQSIKQCIDAATDKMMNSMGGQMSKESCSKQDMQRVGNTIVVESMAGRVFEVTPTRCARARWAAPMSRTRWSAAISTAPIQ